MKDFEVEGARLLGEHSRESRTLCGYGWFQPPPCLIHCKIIPLKTQYRKHIRRAKKSRLIILVAQWENPDPQPPAPHI
jgi:hypothetical protein